MVGCTSAFGSPHEATGKSVSAITADATRPGASPYRPGAASEELSRRDRDEAGGRMPPAGSLRKFATVRSVRRLVKVDAPAPGDMVVGPAIYQAMSRIIELAEGRGEEATLVDFRFARSIRAAMFKATGVCVAGMAIDADVLEAFLGRVRDACDQLERVRRIG